LKKGDAVMLVGVQGMTELNGVRYTVGNTAVVVASEEDNSGSGGSTSPPAVFTLELEGVTTAPTADFVVSDAGGTARLLYGTFRLNYQPALRHKGFTTAPIAFDAPASAQDETEATRGTSVQARLQALPLMGRVAVERQGAVAQGGDLKWHVTFLAPHNAGNILRRLRVAPHQNRLAESMEVRTALTEEGAAYSLVFSTDSTPPSGDTTRRLHAFSTGFVVARA
jgi:hypothetical protein